MFVILSSEKGLDFGVYWQRESYAIHIKDDSIPVNSGEGNCLLPLTMAGMLNRIETYQNLGR